MTYDLQPMRAPRAAGSLLRTLVALLEHPLTGRPLAKKLIADAGITALHATSCDEPLLSEHPVFADHPTDSASGRVPALATLVMDLPAKQAGFAFETAGDFTRAYREGKTSPVQVAERLIETIAANDRLTPAMRPLIAHDPIDLLAQAEASAERHRQGCPIGPLDGVPVAVKDEVDMAPYPTSAGTRFLGQTPAKADSTVVARLRAAGALLIGKANMHELGLGVTGLNPHHGAARNPYDPHRATGGSSSGSAAAVAAGLCPVAVGADGGGSIRIPAALCGLVGLKATFGRISSAGAIPLCWSVGHIGPIGATVRDVAAAYAVMAGPDPQDAASLRQPPLRLDGLAERDLTGIRLGVFRPWFEDAAPDVVAACRRLLDGLVDAGAQLVDIDIPELNLLSLCHTVTITSEMVAGMRDAYASHGREFGYDTRFSLGLARHLSALDYLAAQRHRGRFYRQFSTVLTRCDAIVTPTTACTAPLLPLDAMTTGESNLALLETIMRYARPANLTGLPAISLPAGYDQSGMPIGLQLMGRAWEEHLLLRIGLAAEALIERRAPRIHTRLLTR